jgi:cytochrome c5
MLNLTRCFVEEESDMKKFLPLAIILIVLVAVPMTLMATGTSSGIESQEVAAEPIDMEAAQVTFEATCAKCHSLKRPLGKKKDQAGWEKTITRMSSYHKRQKGRAISEEDQKAVVQYLLSVAGK